MFRLILPALLLLARGGNAQESASTLSDVQNALSSAGIVPDVIPSFNPTAFLDVTYTVASSQQRLSVTPGINLTVPEVVNEPQFFLTSHDPSVAQKTFVLAMVDPDAPTPQNRSLAEIRHVLVPSLRISGNSANKAQLVNSTPAISEYLSPGPPPGSGPHRYTLLLFVQPDGFLDAAAALVNSSTPITNFNISSFASQTGLGAPIAGNFFLTGPDTSTNTTTSGNSTSGSSGSGSAASTSSGARPSASSNGALTPGAGIEDLLVMLLTALLMALRSGNI
ncbi:phosphatidylethanolamine-binding protein [Gloeopeniophorella convolvens]|nr:phosphatidylethanolamine-binding protein [Gloeopeniophorella convolvens]